MKFSVRLDGAQSVIDCSRKKKSTFESRARKIKRFVSAVVRVCSGVTPKFGPHVRSIYHQVSIEVSAT